MRRKNGARRAGPVMVLTGGMALLLAAAPAHAAIAGEVSPADGGVTSLREVQDGILGWRGIAEGTDSLLLPGICWTAPAARPAIGGPLERPAGAAPKAWPPISAGSRTRWRSCMRI